MAGRVPLHRGRHLTSERQRSREVVAKALGLIARPGLEGGDKLDLVDQGVLKREQSQEEMAFGGHGTALRACAAGDCIPTSGAAQTLVGGGIMTIPLPFGAIAIFAVGDRYARK